jgi:hypothetical protein
MDWLAFWMHEHMDRRTLWSRNTPIITNWINTHWHRRTSNTWVWNRAGIISTSIHTARGLWFETNDPIILKEEHRRLIKDHDVKMMLNLSTTKYDWSDKSDGFHYITKTSHNLCPYVPDPMTSRIQDPRGTWCISIFTHNHLPYCLIFSSKEVKRWSITSIIDDACPGIHEESDNQPI